LGKHFQRPTHLPSVVIWREVEGNGFVGRSLTFSRLDISTTSFGADEHILGLRRNSTLFYIKGNLKASPQTVNGVPHPCSSLLLNPSRATVGAGADFRYYLTDS